MSFVKETFAHQNHHLFDSDDRSDDSSDDDLLFLLLFLFAEQPKKKGGGGQEIMGEGVEVPKMSPMDESLARASLTSGVHPPHADAIDYPLVAFFQMKSLPSDEHIQGILNKLAKFPRFRCKVEPVIEGNVLGKLHWVPTEIRFQKHVTRKDDVHSQEELDKIKNWNYLQILK